MVMLSRTVALSILGTSAIFVWGASMAAGVPLAGLFSIDHNLAVVGGSITADCPAGSVCTVLPGTGDGMLVRTVQNTGSGESYIQTIIAENGVNGFFANEQDVQQGVQGAEDSSNIAQKMVIQDPVYVFSLTHEFVGDGYTSSLSADPYFTLNQNYFDADVGQKVRIQGAINGADGDVCDTGATCSNGTAGTQTRAIAIDQTANATLEYGDFAFRWANTPAAFANQDLYMGQGGAVVSSGAAGTNVAGLFFHQGVTDEYGAADFGIVKFFTGVTAGGDVTTQGGSDPDAIFFTTPGVDPTDGYGVWGANSVAEHIFGGLNDLSDFTVQPLMDAVP